MKQAMLQADLMPGTRWPCQARHENPSCHLTDPGLWSGAILLSSVAPLCLAHRVQMVGNLGAEDRNDPCVTGPGRVRQLSALQPCLA